MVTHSGGCHCGRVRFEVSAPARIEVTDASARAVAPRDATSEEDSGRGLALVGNLAKRWGVRPLPGGGKTVWFEVLRSPGDTPPAFSGDTPGPPGPGYAV